MSTLIPELIYAGYKKQDLLALNQDDLAMLVQQEFILNKFSHAAAVLGGKASAAKRRKMSSQSHFEHVIHKFFEGLGGQKVLHRNMEQKHNTQEELYNHAEQMKPKFELGLNHGKAVDKHLNAKVIRPTSKEEFDNVLKEKGAAVIIAPLKGKARAAEKVNNKYNGDWKHLSDLNRATIAVDHAKNLIPAVKATIHHMEKNGWRLAEHNNRTHISRSMDGYRDIMLNFKRNGHTAEVQINTKHMIKAKEGPGHKHYEEMRRISNDGKKKLHDMTPEERNRYKELQRKSRHLYNRSWRMSTKHHYYKSFHPKG